MTCWSDLEAELDLWSHAGATATMWWRDDDTQAPTAELEPLLRLSDKYGVPVHLAVIPAQIDPGLRSRLMACRDVHVLQHGFAHINHEPEGARASEIGEHRHLDAQLDDLREGWKRLMAADLLNLVPGLVPPWNRISDAALRALPGLGYRLFSSEGPTTPDLDIPDLTRIDGHVDPIRWKHGRRFRGPDTMRELFVEHLAARRTGRAIRDEPTGLLTHHLQTGADAWAFIDELFDRLSRNSAVKWVRMADLIERI